MTRSPFKTTRTAGFIALLLALTAWGCQVEPDVTYGLETLELGSATADKDRLKSLDQWIVILHADLFGESLGSADLFDIKQAFMSVGDQDLAREVLISNFMQDPNVVLPDPAEIMNDPDTFINDTYVRFLVRYPTEAERTWLKNFLSANPTVTPELMFTAFALSEEYLHY